MEILTNKNEIIKLIEETSHELQNFSKDNKVSSVTKCIKEKVMKIGCEIFKSWFAETYGNGYNGTFFQKNVDGKNITLKFNGYNEKNYLCCLGDIQIKRAYYISKDHCCYPLEDEEEWLKSEFMPDIKELSCFVSMIEPYDLASNMLERVGNITISSASLQKITKAIGNELVKKEDEEADNYSVSNREKEKKRDLLVISTDGCCINTKEGWKEVKNGAVYEIEKKSNGNLHAFNKSYISRIEDSNNFGNRLFMEARRRNIHLSENVVFIGDGAKWIWKLCNKHFPQSIQIVDWYHATEHLWKITELLYGNRQNESGKIFEKECEDLLYSGLILLLKDKIEEMRIRNVKEKSQRYKDIVSEINYFISNQHRMKYKEFEQKEYPIGSGVIEGACKHLVQIRMKRNGMKWSYEGAHDILQLRCLYLSNRWNEVENVIERIPA